MWGSRPRASRSHWVCGPWPTFGVLLGPELQRLTAPYSRASTTARVNIYGPSTQYCSQPDLDEPELECRYPRPETRAARNAIPRHVCLAFRQGSTAVSAHWPQMSCQVPTVICTFRDTASLAQRPHIHDRDPQSNRATEWQFSDTAWALTRGLRKAKAGRHTHVPAVCSECSTHRACLTLQGRSAPAQRAP